MSIYYVDGQPQRVRAASEFVRQPRPTTTHAETVRAWRARNPERARQQTREAVRRYRANHTASSIVTYTGTA